MKTHSNRCIGIYISREWPRIPSGKLGLRLKYGYSITTGLWSTWTKMITEDSLLWEDLSDWWTWIPTHFRNPRSSLLALLQADALVVLWSNGMFSFGWQHIPGLPSRGKREVLFSWPSDKVDLAFLNREILVLTLTTPKHYSIYSLEIISLHQKSKHGFDKVDVEKLFTCSHILD